MKEILLGMVLFIYVLGSAQEVRNRIKGVVTDGETPIENVSVAVQGSEKGVKTNKEGRYVITAQPFDVLIFRYVGFQDVEIVVEDVTRILNIEMSSPVEQLEEVVVKGKTKTRLEQLKVDYATNKEIISTTYGIIDRRSYRGAAHFLGGDEINHNAQCILDVVRSRFPGVQVFGDCYSGGLIEIRRRPAIFEVDGQVFKETPIWLVPETIDRIAVLSGATSIGRYGVTGAGGVIIINTKYYADSFSSQSNISRSSFPYNPYQDDAIGIEAQKENSPNYLIEFYSCSNMESARDMYKKNRKIYRNSPYYFIDSYTYFKDMGDGKFANKIIESQMYLFEDNPVFAKALAYQFDANGDTKSSKDLYEKIFILRPSYAQSYRDLANSYRDYGNYKKSASMYVRYNYLLQEGFLKSDSIGIQPIIEREYNNLLVLENDKLFERPKSRVRSNEYSDFQGTRLFFEWNDSEAEFELQFVNPENNYFTWKHTMEANSERIKDEKLKGYSSEEFLINSSLSGEWHVNLNYKGNKKLTPTYIKITIYYNFGQSTQRREVKVFRLQLKNVNQKLFSVVYTDI